jgi:hypothetical protein
MKIASFFIALFVSVLTHARTAAAFEADYVITAPPPSSKKFLIDSSCQLYL